MSRSEQRTRFTIRQVDPVRQWKLSPMDLASLDKWDDYTEAKEAMFLHTDTADAPWTVVKSNDKKRARLEAMRHVLSRFDYAEKDDGVVGAPDPLIVGPARDLFEAEEAASALRPLRPRRRPRPEPALTRPPPARATCRAAGPTARDHGAVTTGERRGLRWLRRLDALGLWAPSGRLAVPVIVALVLVANLSASPR